MVFNYEIQNTNNSTPYLKSYETQLYRKGSIIYSKGEKINFIYIILNGEIESFLEENKNLNSNLILKKGSSLGLMDFILNRNYSKTMIAKKVSVLALVNKNYFLDFLKPFKYESILLKTLAMDIDNQNKDLWS
jgi:CRP-like cAMP-binding protein